MFRSLLPLLTFAILETTCLATQAAKELNLSVCHVYTLVSRYRASDGLLTSLVPTAPKGGRGNSRLSPVVEGIITRTIDKVYLTKQKRMASDVIFEIQKRYFGGCDWLT